MDENASKWKRLECAVHTYREREREREREHGLARAVSLQIVRLFSLVKPMIIYSDATSDVVIRRVNGVEITGETERRCDSRGITVLPTTHMLQKALGPA